MSLKLSSTRLQGSSWESKIPLLVTPTKWESQRDRESGFREGEGHVFLVAMTSDARGRRGEASGGDQAVASLAARPRPAGLKFTASVFHVSTPVSYFSEASDSELGELGEGV